MRRWLANSAVMVVCAAVSWAQTGTIAASKPADQPTADIRVDVALVSVTVSVTDRDGVPLDGLSARDFTLLDNGEPREIEAVWQERDLPLTVGLIVDVSGSQRDFWDRHHETAAEFLRQMLGPDDRAFLISVWGEIGMMTDVTGDLAELERGVARLSDRNRRTGEPFGEPCPRRNGPPPRYVPLVQERPPSCYGTPLWEAVFSAARMRMRDIQGRKALIVLSDGKDTGSPHSLNDAIEAAQGANLPVYSIISSGWMDGVFGRLLGGFGNRMNGGFNGRGDLKRLSEETGGRSFGGSDDGSAEVFTEIEDELRSQYVLAFTVPEEARDGQFHQLEVKVDRKGAKIRARAGYQATQ